MQSIIFLKLYLFRSVVGIAKNRSNKFIYCVDNYIIVFYYEF